VHQILLTIPNGFCWTGRSFWDGGIQNIFNFVAYHPSRYSPCINFGSLRISKAVSDIEITLYVTVEQPSRGLRFSLMASSPFVLVWSFSKRQVLNYETKIYKWWFRVSFLSLVIGPYGMALPWNQRTIALMDGSSSNGCKHKGNWQL